MLLSKRIRSAVDRFSGPTGVLLVTLLVVTSASVAVGGVGRALAEETTAVQLQEPSTSAQLQESSTDVLYRVNAGGDTIAVADGPDWIGSNGTYVTGGKSYSKSHSITFDESVPGGTPESLFQSELYGDTQWAFPVTAGETYEVRVYFAEIFWEQADARLFDTTIEGSTVLDDYDIYADVGHDVGTMKNYTVTPEDDTLDLSFLTEVDNAKVSAVEIVATDGQDSTDSSTLTGPDAVDFGQVSLGNTSTETVTLTNPTDSSSDVTVTNVSVSGTNASAYSHDVTENVTLAPGESTDVNVTFTPEDIGVANATLDVEHTGNNTPLSVALTGEGVDDTSESSTLDGPASVDFGAVTVGNTSTETVTLTNPSNSDSELTITNVSVTGPDADVFTDDVSENVTLAPGESTDVNVTFAPDTTGVANATLDVEHTGNNTPFTVDLTGEGVSDSPDSSTLDGPASVDFGAVTVGNTSTETVTLTNPTDSSSDVTVTNVSISGDDAGAYSHNVTENVTLAPGESTDVAVTFAPDATGVANATLVVEHTGDNTPLAVDLTGEGVDDTSESEPTLDGPASVDFGQVPVGNTSTETLTLTNPADSSSELTITGATITGTNASAYSHDVTENVTLAPGESTDVNVTFAPDTTGVANATLDVEHTGNNTPLAVALTGEGVDDTSEPAPSDPLYRVNAGGETIAVADGPDWVGSNGTYVTGGKSYSKSHAITLDSSVPDGTPESLFQSELYGDTQWTFPVTAGETYEVRVYFAEIYWEQADARLFDVAVEGSTVLDDYDIYADVGHDVGTMKSYTVTPQDDALDLSFLTEVDNAKVSAVEVVAEGDQNDTESSTLDGPASVDFGSVIVGNSSTETVTLTNPTDSDSEVTITNVTLSGTNASAYSHNVSGEITLAPGESTDVAVTFTPDATGVANATLDVEHTGDNTPLAVDLTGEGVDDTGESEPTLDGPASVDFGTVTVGNSSTETLTLTNPADSSSELTITGATLSGTNASAYSHNVSENVTLAPGESTDVAVTFAPDTTGVANATLDVEHTGNDTPHTVDLTGEGVTDATDSSTLTGPSSLDFGQVQVNNTSTETVTLTNSADSDSDVTITNVSVTEDSTDAYSHNASGEVTLAPGESTDVAVTFAPNATGVANATLVVDHTGNNTPFTVDLTGEGVDSTDEPTSTGVLYRVNAGGDTVSVADGPDWVASDGTYVTGGKSYSKSDAITFDGSVPDGTPEALFQSELYGDTQWAFPVTAGETYEVRVYLAEIFWNEPDARLFDVVAEDSTVLDDYDIYADVGHDVGTMKSYTVTPADDTLDLSFLTEVDNAKVSAVEVLGEGDASNTLGGPNSLDFGQVQVNDTSTETVTLTNLGDPQNSSHQDITITNVSVADDDAGAYSHNVTENVTLAPGESTDVAVTFAPDAGGVAEATLVVDHTGDNTPFTVDLTGEGVSGVSIGFGADTLDLSNVGVDLNNPTSLQFGPDGRLYVSEQHGDIYAFTVSREGANDYVATAAEHIESVEDLPNHDDDGNYDSSVSGRQITGILVTGTAENPVLYVTSSDPRIGGGQSGEEKPIDTNSGVISRLTWNGTAWDHEMLVRGLPRSEENHAPNGMALDEQTNTLYVTVGGNTNKGAPSNNFAYTAEYALAAAILEVDLDQIDQNYPEQDAAHTTATYRYDLPTLQDTSTPFGGQDGLNMAMLVQDGPVQMYSPGYRNAYDVVLTEDGQMYTVDNGPNGGWGGPPINEGPGGACTNEPNENDSDGSNDQLYLVTEGFYGGHPNPTRGNPDGAGLYDENGNQIGSVADAVYDGYDNPVECDLQEDDYLADFSASTNGITEYTASNFEGEMQGDLLTSSFDGNVYRIQLDASGEAATDVSALLSSSGTLDVIAQGDDGQFPGTIWSADYGADGISVFEPNDFDGTSDSCDASDPDGDADGDGYTNQDEKDNDTDPCSAASVPPDYDDDGVSDLNDPDDDNDGIPDTDDEFAVDPDNGLTTTLPVEYNFSRDSQPESLEGLGFTGLMMNGTDYQDLYTSEDVIFGGANPALTVEKVRAGTATGSENTQHHAFQFGVDAPGKPFSVSAPLTGFPAEPEPGQSAGIYLGTGDQDNYVKLVVSATDGTGGVEFAKEVDGSYTTVASPNDATVTGASTVTDLNLTVYPSNDTVVASYAVDGGESVVIGETTIPGTWLTDSEKGLAVGVISTTGGASEFAVTWTDIYVVALNQSNTAPIADAGSDQTVEEGSSVTLDATGSSDPEGDSLTYEWTQTAGPSVTLQNANTATPSFTAPDVENDTTLTFEVTVSDGEFSDVDAVNVTVQEATQSSELSSTHLAVTPNDNDVDTSAYSSGSFQIENTGETNITSITFDLRTASFPDMVFDPEGTAGDSASKGFKADSGASETGLEGHAFSAPHNGVDADDGYDVLRANFSDFETGEVFTFSTDNDPTSIKGAPSTHPAGPVSGLELAGATVTITYDNGDTQTVVLASDGSQGGAQTTAKANLTAAPTIGVQNVSLASTTLGEDTTAATVEEANQTVLVSGSAGQTVVLTQVEAELNLEGVDGYDIEAFEANKALEVTEYTVTLGEDGTAEVPVTLTNSTDVGGLNYFFATGVDEAGDPGMDSNVVVLEYQQNETSTS